MLTAFVTEVVTTPVAIFVVDAKVAGLMVIVPVLIEVPPIVIVPDVKEPPIEIDPVVIPVLNNAAVPVVVIDVFMVSIVGVVNVLFVSVCDPSIVVISPAVVLKPFPRTCVADRTVVLLILNVLPVATLKFSDDVQLKFVLSQRIVLSTSVPAFRVIPPPFAVVLFAACPRMLVTVPAVNVSVELTVIDVALTIEATVTTPDPKFPVPAVAVILCPGINPVVETILVIVAVYGPDPDTAPIVPVVLIVAADTEPSSIFLSSTANVLELIVVVVPLTIKSPDNITVPFRLVVPPRAFIFTVVNAGLVIAPVPILIVF
jgi:hypothetical protein